MNSEDKQSIEYSKKSVKPHRVISQKQKTFVHEYLNNGGNATEAASIAYNVKDRVVAGSIGSENLHKPVVLAHLNRHEEEAEVVVTDIMLDKDNEKRDRLAAAKLLLSYTRGNPVSRNENINVNITLEDILSS